MMNDGNLFHASREKATEIPHFSFLIPRSSLFFVFPLKNKKPNAFAFGLVTRRGVEPLPSP